MGDDNILFFSDFWVAFTFFYLEPRFRIKLVITSSKEVYLLSSIFFIVEFIIVLLFRLSWLWLGGRRKREGIRVVEAQFEITIAIISG